MPNGSSGNIGSRFSQKFGESAHAMPPPSALSEKTSVGWSQRATCSARSNDDGLSHFVWSFEYGSANGE